MDVEQILDSETIVRKIIMQFFKKIFESTVLFTFFSLIYTNEKIFIRKNLLLLFYLTYNIEYSHDMTTKTKVYAFIDN